jgi:hypothetical protein
MPSSWPTGSIGARASGKFEGLFDAMKAETIPIGDR